MENQVSGNTILEMKGIVKAFSGVTVLDGVQFDLRRGEAHALIGENGAGKSTLMKILNGIYIKDAGEIFIDGEKEELGSIAAAKAKGISIIHQELSLVPEMTVAENVFLGRELTRWGFWIDWKRMRRITAELFHSLSIMIPDISTPVGLLSGGQRQAVAFARAMANKSAIMFFDEPTAAMGVRESAQILQLISSLRKENITVIMIGHNLFQVFDVADRVAVMAAGKLVASAECRNSSPEMIHNLIIGKGEPA